MLNTSSGIEQNLNAVFKSPVIHREELLGFVNRPEVIPQTYQVYKGVLSETVRSLHDLVKFTLDNIEDDPYVKLLRSKSNVKSHEMLATILATGKTWCRQEIQSLDRRATVIYTELGIWAADTFVQNCCENFSSQLKSSVENVLFVEWDMEEKIYMSKLLERITPPPTDTAQNSLLSHLSDKAEKLLKILVGPSATNQRVIIFAKERTTVVMLAQLLSTHPRTQHLKTGYFLGTSNFAGRKSSLHELSHPRDQRSALDDLRTGLKNVLVATAVLEMGIDVSACNMVICFDAPSNLTSFIQRRGRAREKNSRLYLFIEQDDKKKWKDWEAMEAVLKRVYLDDAREAEKLKQISAVDELSHELYTIPTTG